MDLSAIELFRLWHQTKDFDEQIKLVRIFFSRLNRNIQTTLPADQIFRQIVNQCLVDWGDIWSNFNQNIQKLMVLYCSKVYSSGEYYFFIRPNQPIAEIENKVIKLEGYSDPPLINSRILNPYSGTSWLPAVLSLILEGTEISPAVKSQVFASLNAQNLETMFNSARTQKLIEEAVQYYIWTKRGLTWNSKIHWTYPEATRKQIETILILNKVDTLISQIPLEMLFAVFEYF